MTDYVDEMLTKIKVLRSKVEPSQQKLLHINSMYNFILYIDELNSIDSKTKVKELIEEYFSEINSLRYFIDKVKSRELGFSYLRKIGYYYRREAGFKYYTPISSIIIIGGSVDLLLFFFGILQILYYVPVVTTIMFMEWLYIRIFYVSKNKVYGLDV